MVYQGDAGALQENYSDIVGEAIEQIATGTRDWLSGTGSYFGVFRNRADPSNIPATSPYYSYTPDRYYHPEFYTGTEDYGGVHYNANVVNKAAYLAAMGGTFNGYTIAGIGTAKMERIWYRAVAQYYTATATFNEAYFDLIQAATDLYGAQDVAEVRKALQAAEIDHVRPTVPASDVIDRRVFYNNSSFDATNDADAIATDNVALLPGQAATSANYTNYSRGINGVMIDVAHLVNYTTSPTGLTAADFEFRTGNNAEPATWTAAPAPQSIAFDGKTGRVTIT